jgi:hypothetical protein
MQILHSKVLQKHILQPSKINDVTAGPACLQLQSPLKNPAPIIAQPKQRGILKTMFFLTFSSSDASFSKTDSGFVFQIDIYLLFCY